MALNEKQKRFAEEYVMSLNATQAATRAGYSEKTAYSQGHRLLTNDEVSKYIQVLREELQEKTEITKEMIINEAAQIAFGNVSKVARWTNNVITLIPSNELPDEVKATIAEIKETKFGISIKQYDKLRALDLISKILGFYEDGKDKGEAPPLRIDDP